MPKRARPLEFLDIPPELLCLCLEMAVGRLDAVCPLLLVCRSLRECVQKARLRPARWWNPWRSLLKLGKISEEFPLLKFSSLETRMDEFTDAEMKILADHGVKSLAVLTGLRFLMISGRSPRSDFSDDSGVQPLWRQFVTDDGVEALSEMSCLRHLELTGWTLTDRGMKSLSTMSHLRELRLEGRGLVITDVGMHSLSALTGLEELFLDGCDDITDAGVQSLPMMIGLQELALHGSGVTYPDTHTGVTDVGMYSLSTMTGLKTLELSICYNITDAGVQSLSRMVGLRVLFLCSCENITDVGVQSLQFMYFALGCRPTRGCRRCRRLPTLSTHFVENQN